MFELFHVFQSNKCEFCQYRDCFYTCSQICFAYILVPRVISQFLFLPSNAIVAASLEESSLADIQLCFFVHDHGSNRFEQCHSGLKPC